VRCASADARPGVLMASDHLAEVAGRSARFQVVGE
jgi:hypothetical protein